MENRGVLIGSIIFVFASFFLMIGALVYESYKAKQMRQLALSITTEAKVVAAPAAQDFSVYKTLVGDDGREMVQISEGPFVMGSRDNDSDPDEKPEHQAYWKPIVSSRKSSIILLRAVMRRSEPALVYAAPRRTLYVPYSGLFGFRSRDSA